jgi:hypothetical protein
VPESVKHPPLTTTVEHAAARHDIDLEGLTGGSFITLNGHWYGLETADMHTGAHFHPERTEVGATNVHLSLVHCPWMGCPAMSPPLSIEEIRFDEFTSGRNRAVRLTHLPTGLVASADVETSMLQTREKLLIDLTARVAERRRHETGGGADGD